MFREMWKLSVLVVVMLALAAVAGTVAGKTIGDVVSCINGNLKSCHDKCSPKIPADKKTEVEKCFTDPGHPFGATKDCLGKHGITDKSPCFKAPRNPPPGSPIPQIHVPPTAVITKFKEFLDCVHECVMKRKECDDGCPEASNQVKSSLDACLKEAQKKGVQLSKGPIGCLEKLTD